nr:outer membrane protein [Pararhizobium capsulatum]
MINWRHVLLAASAPLVLAIAPGFTSSAHAADDLLDAPEVTISSAENATSGIYLRGDIGYAPWSSEGDPSLRFDAPAPAGLAGVTFDDARFGKPLSGSVGIGYQFNDMVRADFTTDYFKDRFEGRGESAAPCAGEGAGTSCGLNANADYRAIGLMANGYVDLGTLAGFTPYIGGGIGSTHLSWDSVSVSGVCIDGAGACAGGPATADDFNGENSWRFTYALMAGFSYDLSDRLKLDFGYRYSDITGGDIFRGTNLRGKDDGLSRHEFRAGLRFSLW